KSPMPATLHDASGRTARPADLRSPLPTMVDPSISHSTSSPDELRQRMSLLVSPLKSPTPATLHAASGFTATPPEFSTPLDTIVEPLMVHSTSVPSVLRQSTSEPPAPVKSLIPATLQLALRATTVPFEVSNPLDEMAPPFMVQSASVPLLLRQRISLLPSLLRSSGTRGGTEMIGAFATPIGAVGLAPIASSMVPAAVPSDRNSPSIVPSLA